MKLFILAYLEIKRIEFSKDISSVLADSKNHIILNSDILQMDTSFRAKAEAVTVKK